MKTISEYMEQLSINSMQFLYEVLGLVFHINDGHLTGISTEEQ